MSNVKVDDFGVYYMRARNGGRAGVEENVKATKVFVEEYVTGKSDLCTNGSAKRKRHNNTEKEKKNHPARQRNSHRFVR